ncbi:MAG: aminoglycoside 6-adenylyltransferase [Clostridia bacterium]|nr:aminoglycoside 6-adenylyltransferase [Clostridia bacterium]
MDPYIGVEERFVAFAGGEPRIAAVVVIGSRARDDRPADAYSDLDILLVVEDPAFFLETDDWLWQIGEFHISFVEETIGGAKERRVLFDDALDVDFVLLPEAEAWSALRSAEAIGILQRGYRVLVDKRGFFALLPGMSIRPSAATLPDEAEFLNNINDFWYHAVWTAKKLLRGEVWMAISCLDCYMKHKLLWMIEQHARATHGPQRDTWFAGRFLDTWADDATKDALRHAFARYETQDIKRALFETMDLFRSLAVESTEKLGFCYPCKADRVATQWVIGALYE